MSSDAFSQTFLTSSQQDKEKVQWAVDFLNLDGEDLAKLFDLGGPCEPGHDITTLDVENMEGSSCASIPLVNETLESLIQDLQDLSETENGGFVPPHRNFVLRNDVVKSVQVANVYPSIPPECSKNGVTCAHEPSDDGIIFSMKGMCSSGNKADYEKNSDIPVEEGSSSVGESVDTKNVTHQDRYACKGIRPLSPYHSETYFICNENETDAEIRSIVKNIVLLVSSDDADSMPNMLLNNLEKKVAGFTVVELEENLAQDKKLHKQNSKEKLPEDNNMRSSIMELEVNMAREQTFPQQNSDAKSIKLNKEKGPSCVEAADIKNGRSVIKREISSHRSQKKKPRYECSECGSCFQMAAVYSRHVSTHVLKARECNLKAKLKIKLSSLSFQEEKFVCDFCSKIYKRAVHFKRHMSSEHSSEHELLPFSRRGKKATSKTISTNANKKSQNKSLLLSTDEMVKCQGQLFDDNNNSDKEKGSTSIRCNTVISFGNNTSNSPPQCSEVEPATDSLLKTGSVRHYCSHCLLSFETLSDLVQHKQLHPLALLCLKCTNAFSLDNGFDIESCQHFTSLC